MSLGNVISHSNGLSSAASNLIIMTDSATIGGLEAISEAANSTSSIEHDEHNCNERGLFECTGTRTSQSSQCYSFLEICDQICQCSPDCTDEALCNSGQDKKSLRFLRQNSQSAFLLEQEPNDFWKVVRLPANGTLSMRVPFKTQARLFLEASSLGSRGVSNLGKNIS